VSRVRRVFPPPVRCSDTAESTGQTCRRWAVPWSNPARCRRHGGEEPATPTDPDPVAEDIARLEARPTPKRIAEAVRLRQPREHVLTLHGQPDAPPAPLPSVAPPPELAQPGRRTTRLGSRPGGQINTLGG
jgi:hypothetical protein